MYNVLTKAAVDLPVNTVDVEEIILAAFDGIDKIYSYIVYAKYKDGRLDHWKVEFMLSQQDEYNQLNISNVAHEVATLTELSVISETQKVLGYKQPGPEILLTVYEPLMNSLVRQEHNRWHHLEYEDLIQMCRLVLMRLYRNGYYIHKQLLRRAFANEVLMYIRKDRNKPTILSMDSLIYSDGKDEDITLSEMLPDTQAILDEQDMLDNEANKNIIEAKRKIIVDRIGQRQYDQLLREYGNGMTTSWSRKTVQDLKRYLDANNINDSTFDKYN